MSRYCPHDISPVLAAAKRWQERCLLDDQSVFSENPLWTGAAIVDLRRVLADPPDPEEKSGFLAQLKARLQSTPPASQQLAAEMLWVLLLFPHAKSFRGDVKAELTTTVWEWSGTPLQPGHPMLLKPLEQGIGHPGAISDQTRWQELHLMTRLAEEFKREAQIDRERLLSDPWVFGNWVDAATEGADSALPHILKFMVFPDFYERIAGREDKLRIAAVFSADVEDLADCQATAVDRALYDIRLRLETEHDTEELDFFRPPLRSMWISAHAPVSPRARERKGAAADTKPVYWMEKTAYREQPFRRSGEWAVGRALISPRHGLAGRDVYQSMREVQPGDRVLHFVDGELIAGISKVKDKVQNHPEGLPGTDLAGRPAYVVPLQDYRPLAPTISRNDILALPMDMDVLRQLTDFDTGLAYSRHLEGSADAYLAMVPAEFVHTLADHYRAQTEQYLPHGEREPPPAKPTAPAPESKPPQAAEPAAQKYPVDDLIADVFLDGGEFCDLVDLLRFKKNLILQGPPGVGKTFLANRLALAITSPGQADQIKRVPLHPGYGHGDFAGYDASGQFRAGHFADFCRRAGAAPGKPHVFILDDVDLNALRRIFGEFITLIEVDKRSADWALTLGAAPENSAPFYVPDNIHLLGLANTALRPPPSEADFSLRRRFAFADLEPGFETPQFKRHLRANGVDESLVDQIVAKMSALNQRIAKKTGDLGPGFRIGHSFFCHFPQDATPDRHWYNRIVRHEIAPLIREYWLADPAQADILIEELLKSA